jgi:hypothetical protein
MSSVKDTGASGQADTGTAIVTISDITTVSGTVDEIVDRIRAEFESGVQHFTTVCLLIKRLKELRPDDWKELVQERCGVARSRAYELLRIVDGKDTVGENRAKTAERQRRHHAVRYNGRGSPGSPSPGFEAENSTTPEAKPPIEAAGDRGVQGHDGDHLILWDRSGDKAENAAPDEEVTGAINNGPAIFRAVRSLYTLANHIEGGIITVDHALAWIRAFPDDREDLLRVIDFVKRIEAALNEPPPDDTPTDPSGGSKPEGEPKDTTPPTESEPAAGTISAVEEPTAPTIDTSLDIPDHLIQAARERHPVASAPQDTPIPAPATPPAPTPAPSRTPPTSPAPKLTKPARPTPPTRHRNPLDGWRKIKDDADDLQYRADLFRALAGKGVQFSDAEWDERDKVLKRVSTLRAADRAERPRTAAGASHV